MSAYEPSGRPSSRAATTTAASEVLQNSTAATFNPTVPSIRDAVEQPQHYGDQHHHHHHRSGTGFRSEHGHHLHSIAPLGAHSGASVVAFFSGLFQTILAISTLGASVTFNFVLSNAPGDSQPNSTFSQATVQLFLSLSWLLYILALAVAATGSTLLTFFKSHWQQDWDGVKGRTSQVTVHWYAVSISALMGMLVIGAFVLLCLVVVAYSKVVGWIALGFTCFFGGIIVMGIGMQVPWPCMDRGSHAPNTPRGIDEKQAREDSAVTV
ncbi:uncharacterized protein AB675_10317 [Cyphellophora attinorum]|uniref:Uncharacterized protein n=1 Tax=Cyphellophora attinorum TaxID=1664694 RepID=A0A0N0NK49_9EURO|nr:uncharacterized protein AB675_10317 [Phialophora attinorum]KPI37409.1 hypothetical protein AB675_10317 [Phialophora attinorum]